MPHRWCGLPVWARCNGGAFEDAEAALARSDYAAAVPLLGPLAAGGHTGAQTNLGILYKYGWGVSENYAEA